MLHFFLSIASSLLRRGCVTGPGDVSSRKVGGSTLRLLLVTPAGSPLPHLTVRSRLNMSGAERLSALLFVWILCGVTGSAEAQTLTSTPAPASSESRFIWSAKKTPTLFSPVRPGSARSHVTRKTDL